MMVDVLSGSFDTAIVLLQLAVGDDGKTIQREHGGVAEMKQGKSRGQDQQPLLTTMLSAVSWGRIGRPEASSNSPLSSQSAMVAAIALASRVRGWAVRWRMTGSAIGSGGSSGGPTVGGHNSTTPACPAREAI